MSKKDFELAFDILKNYSGPNRYIQKLSRDVYELGNNDAIEDFQVEYILMNKDFAPIEINKITKIPDWYGEKKADDWETDFIPEKLLIKTLFGETKLFYHCLVKYRKSVDPVYLFLPKKCVINNFLVPDYKNLYVDFDRYDRLSASNGSSHRIMEHQKEAVKFLLARKKCILADSMGLGKTMSLSVAAIEGNFDSVLVICPASLKTNWKNELLRFIPEKDITIVDGFLNKKKGELEKILGYGEGKSGLSKQELLDEAKERGKWSDNRFVIVNYDILDEFYKKPKTRSAANVAEAFNESPMLKYISGKKSLIIIDEAHRLSNETSDRYKVIKDLIKRGDPDSIYLSTGTPVTNNPRNLYCLLCLLDDPIKDDYNYYVNRYCDAQTIFAKGEKDKWQTIFLNRLCKPSWYSLTDKEKEDLYKFIDKHARKITIATGDSNLDELKERISHIYLRRIKEDMEGMVEKRVHDIRYELTQSQKEEYDRLWDEYEEEQMNLDPEKELNKELLEGAIYRRYLSNEMVPNTIKLADQFINNGEKVVIACCYDDELYTLKEHYGDKAVIFNGKIDLKKKDEAVYRFMNDDNVLVFIGNIQACGVGITLTRANKLIFNNLSFVPSDNYQMEDRIARIGQKKDCDIYYQIFNDTQYEKMLDIVLNKSNVIEQIIKKEDEK